MRGERDHQLLLVKLVKPGAHVKKGDVVAEFDRQYQLNLLDDFKANVIQAESSVKKLKAEMAVAKGAHDELLRGARADLDKARLDLKTIEVRSAIEAEKFKLAAEETDARYRQLLKEIKLFEASQAADLRANQIDLEQAQIELRQAEANVQRMVLRTPVDGLAVMKDIRRGPGQWGQVAVGDQLWPGQSFMQVVDPAAMVINAAVNQVDAELLRVGMAATIRLDGYPGLALPGHVINVGAISKPGGWRPTYMREIAVRLKLDEMDPRVIPDMSASADITLGTEKHATLVPLSSAFQEEAGTPFVFLSTPSGWKRRAIELGKRNHINAVVRSGLHEGDVIAVEKPLS